MSPTYRGVIEAERWPAARAAQPGHDVQASGPLVDADLDAAARASH
jgi:hypothetical protein